MFDYEKCDHVSARDLAELMRGYSVKMGSLEVAPTNDAVYTVAETAIEATNKFGIKNGTWVHIVLELSNFNSTYTTATLSLGEDTDSIVYPSCFVNGSSLATSLSVDATDCDKVFMDIRYGSLGNYYFNPVKTFYNFDNPNSDMWEVVKEQDKIYDLKRDQIGIIKKDKGAWVKLFNSNIGTFAYSDCLDLYLYGYWTDSSGNLVDTGESPFINPYERPYVTPEQFGAVGDGVTDDTEALQSAFDNSNYVILSKTYKVTENIIIDKDEVYVHFANGTINCTDDVETGGVLQFIGYHGSVSSTATTPQRTGVSITGVGKINAENDNVNALGFVRYNNVNITACIDTTSNRKGLTFQYGCHNVTVNGISSGGSTVVGSITVESSCSDFTFINVLSTSSHSSARAMNMNGVNNVTVIGGSFTTTNSSVSKAISLYNCNNVSFFNTKVVSNGIYGITTDNCSNISLYSCDITATTVAVYPVTPIAGNVIFNNNFIDYNASDVIFSARVTADADSNGTAMITMPTGFTRTNIKSINVMAKNSSGNYYKMLDGTVQVYTSTVGITNSAYASGQYIVTFSR